MRILGDVLYTETVGISKEPRNSCSASLCVGYLCELYSGPNTVAHFISLPRYMHTCVGFSCAFKAPTRHTILRAYILK